MKSNIRNFPTLKVKKLKIVISFNGTKLKISSEIQGILDTYSFLLDHHSFGWDLFLYCLPKLELKTSMWKETRLSKCLGDIKLFTFKSYVHE